MLTGMSDARRVRAGEDGEPVLVLLHGLGATAGVWDGWGEALAESWPGRWVALDLPGHGDAPRLPRYSFGSMAAHVAEILTTSGPVVALGHSLGGVVALALSSGWLGTRVTGVVGLGIKVAWTADELARGAAAAARPVTWFESREAAAERFLKVSGLVGQRDASDPVVDAGLRQHDGRWRLAVDPAAFGVGAPDMAGLLAASKAKVLLSRGEHDALVSDDQLAALPAKSAVLPGLGHNAHVEDPRAVAALLPPLLAAPVR
jgi:pimeloyl-ACP methyl ester carboxylesterase